MLHIDNIHSRSLTGLSEVRRVAVGGAAWRCGGASNIRTGLQIATIEPRLHRLVGCPPLRSSTFYHNLYSPSSQNVALPCWRPAPTVLLPSLSSSSRPSTSVYWISLISSSTSPSSSPITSHLMSSHYSRKPFHHVHVSKPSPRLFTLKKSRWTRSTQDNVNEHKAVVVIPWMRTRASQEYNARTNRRISSRRR